MNLESKANNLLEGRFINREMSWLAFNERVLEEAYNTNNPLLERLKFLAISASNLDEFYMVRVASIKLHAGRGNISTEEVKNQIQKINIKADSVVEAQQDCWEKIKTELANEKIYIIEQKNYSESDIKWLKKYFRKEIFPQLRPVIFTSADSFPFLNNLEITAIFSLRKDSQNYKAVIPLPSGMPRFIRLPSNDTKNIRFSLLRDIISMNKKKLFPSYKIIDYGRVVAIRNSELEVSDKTSDLFETFETALKKRMRGEIIRLKISYDMPENLKSFVIKSLDIDPLTVEQGNEFLGLSSIMQLYDVERQNLKFPQLHMRFPERIDDFGGDCLASIHAKDIVVHHPYESFDVVVQFIRQAAHDPAVTDIKQTLYRTSRNSPIVSALIEAAKAGKSVTAVVEPKARFDEEANLRWGKGLMQAGAKVIFGVPGMKTHAKISLITRDNGDEMEHFVHFGTGNYHPLTAKVYSDISYFTCNPVLCRDAETLFSYMAGENKNPHFERIMAAPLNLRKSLLTLIEDEINHARAGRPAGIWLKMNSLVDEELIDALYKASQAGVIINIIVRGICCLRPGIEGLSENIKVKSIIGRFLEHARIFCFGNGHQLPSANNKVFISSADWMQRNMDRRIEAMIPVQNATVHEQILKQIMASNIRDEKQSWIMQPDGSYTRIKADKTSFSAHEFFIANPSLSGRGSALHSKSRRNYGENAELQKVSKETRIAVIDIGSNSIRLVVYDALKRALTPMFNEKAFCQLARDMEKTGKLSAKGVEFAYNTLERFNFLIKAMGIKDVMAFATSAVRDAKDGSIFIKKIEKDTGIKVQLLSGEEEARLAALGIISGFHEVDGVVGDLGGGSLELANIIFQRQDGKIFSEKESLKERKSFPIGPLRLFNMAGGNKAKARRIIDEYLLQFPLKETLKGKTFYAVGGGFRALAKLHMTREKYKINIIQHYKVTPKELQKTIKLVMISGKNLTSLGISSKRADTIAFTALVLERIIELGKPENIVISAYGVREGLLFDKLSPDIQNKDALISGSADIIAHISPNASDEWIGYGNELFDWMTPLFQNETDNIIRLRRAACLLKKISWYEHTAYRAEMAFRWILNAEIPAMDHAERVFLATAVFHRYKTDIDKEITGKAQSILDTKMLYRARVIGLAMRLAHNISGGAQGILPHTRIRIVGKKLELHRPKKHGVLITSDVSSRLEKLAIAMKLKPVIR